MRTLIQHGKVCVGHQIVETDLLMEDEHILDIGSCQKNISADQIIDASGSYILPGFIDFHVHLDDEIGKYYIADTYHSGSQAAIQNGVTTIVSFITQKPNENLTQAIHAAFQKARNNTYTDLTWHLTPTTWDEKSWREIGGWLERGFKTLKLYTTYKEAGIYSDYTLIEEVLRRVKSKGIRVLVHCEDETVLQKAKQYDDLTQSINWAKLRSPEAEVIAIVQLIELAKKTESLVHIVHVSTIEGAKLIQRARKEGVNISCETAPQYLFFNEEWLKGKTGYQYLCTPPLRSEENRFVLESMALESYFDIYATDHCPFTKKDKSEHKENILDVPKGLPGVGALMHIVYKLYKKQGETAFLKMAYHLSENPAKLAGLFPHKGQIAKGADADLVFISMNQNPRRVYSTLSNVYDPTVEFETPLNVDYVFRRGEMIIKNNELIMHDATGKLLIGL